MYIGGSLVFVNSQRMSGQLLKVPSRVRGLGIRVRAVAA